MKKVIKSVYKNVGKSHKTIHKNVKKLIEIAEHYEISIDYLSEIERNKKTPSLKRLILIAEKLNIPVYKLFLE